jgi:hypothetical protein
MAYDGSSYVLFPRKIVEGKASRLMGSRLTRPHSKYSEQKYENKTIYFTWEFQHKGEQNNLFYVRISKHMRRNDLLQVSISK